MPKKDSKTNPSVAPYAAPLANRAAVLVVTETRAKAGSARCIRQFVPSAAVQPKYRLSRETTVRFIAGNVSRRAAAKTVKYIIQIQRSRTLGVCSFLLSSGDEEKVSNSAYL